MKGSCVFVQSIVLLVSSVHAFYLPGVAPTDYLEGDAIPLLVNSLSPLTSAEEPQLKSVISYDYYHPAFHFCEPAGGAQKVPESLGSILFGDRISTSGFEITMLANESCKHLCTSTFPATDAVFVNERIRQNYGYNWLIDGLPAAMVKLDTRTNTEFYSVGFELGFQREEQVFINNHYDIIIGIHQIASGRYRVVGVIVQPDSRAGGLSSGGAPTCEPTGPVYLDETKDSTVDFTYSITWVYSDTVWATRWDKYLHIFDPRIHWFSLINASVIVTFLTGMVATILLRALRRDIARYNQLDVDEDVLEDSGWKLVHGDVFRTPKHSLILSILLGSGSQLFLMTALTIAFALLGLLSPSNRGSLGTAVILLYTLCGSAGGYVSARVYKSLHGDSWKRNIALTPILVPGCVFAIFFFLNFFLIGAGGSGAVPLGTMIALIAIWFVVSVPLSLGGSFFGYRSDAVEAPVRTNQIPRQIPQQKFYLKTIPSMLLAGVLPFGAIFVELYFILNSLWFHKLYYAIGFLFICFGIMIMTCSTVTILMVYFLLCAESYHW